MIKEDRQRIHEETEKRRRDAEREKEILTDTGDYDSSNEYSDSFEEEATRSIRNSKYKDSEGKSYITGDQWRDLSKKHKRRSEGRSEVISERVEKKWIGQQIQ